MDNDVTEVQNQMVFISKDVQYLPVIYHIPLFLHISSISFYLKMDFFLFKLPMLYSIMQKLFLIVCLCVLCVYVNVYQCVCIPIFMYCDEHEETREHLGWVLTFYHVDSGEGTQVGLADVYLEKLSYLKKPINYF